MSPGGLIHSRHSAEPSDSGANQLKNNMKVPIKQGLNNYLAEMRGHLSRIFRKYVSVLQAGTIPFPLMNKREYVLFGKMERNQRRRPFRRLIIL